MQDQTLTCKDCGKDFVWTASEQEFYASKGFSAPIRCADCRRKLKEQRQGGGMSGGSRFDRPRTMYEITCANCGQKGEVPFQPRDPENVLCADCFRKKRDAENGISSPAAQAPAAAPADDMPESDSASDSETDDTAKEGETAEEPKKSDDSEE